MARRSVMQRRISRARDYHEQRKLALYKTRRWTHDLRPRQLRQHPNCKHCAMLGLEVKAVDVDHIIEHKGNEALFFDRNNLQSLCRGHHSKKTRGVTRIGVRADGTPVDTQGDGMTAWFKRWGQQQ